MPEPVLVSIAAALATKAAVLLYDLVKAKFAGRAAAQTLEAAAGSEPDTPEVLELADALAAAERDDPAFGRDLRTEWERTLVQQADRGCVANQITGTVTGKVVQARDIQGGVSFWVYPSLDRLPLDVSPAGNREIGPDLHLCRARLTIIVERRVSPIRA